MMAMAATVVDAATTTMPRRADRRGFGDDIQAARMTIMPMPTLMNITPTLACRPRVGMRTKAAMIEPATAPAVFARYTMPARRPTAAGRAALAAVASGEAGPVD